MDLMNCSNSIFKIIPSKRHVFGTIYLKLDLFSIKRRRDEIFRFSNRCQKSLEQETLKNWFYSSQTHLNNLYTFRLPSAHSSRSKNYNISTYLDVPLKMFAVFSDNSIKLLQLPFGVLDCLQEVTKIGLEENPLQKVLFFLMISI